MFNGETIIILFFLTIFLSFCIFLLLWLNLFFGRNFLQTKGHGQESILGGLLGCFYVTPIPFWKKDHNSWSSVKEKWYKLNFRNEGKKCNTKVHAYMWDKARTYWHHSLEGQTKPLRLLILSVDLHKP